MLVSISIPLVLAAVVPPSFSLFPTSGSYYVGCGSDYQVDMLINTNNNATDSANIIVFYDDTALSITDENSGVAGLQTQPGSIYESYASYTVDEVNDRILMTGYNTSGTYDSGTNFDVFGSFQFTPLAAGTTNLTIDFTPSSTTDSNIAETVTSNDLLNDVESATFNFYTDSVNPSLSEYSPSSGQTGVSVSSNVNFRVQDAECGADLSNLVVTVGGVEYRNTGSNQFSTSGTASNYVVTVNPSTNFAYNSSIPVSIAGQDLVGNSVSASYTFTTESDVSAPTFTAQSPSDAGTGIATNSNVQVTVQDTQSGVDLDTVSFVVDGITYTKTGVNTFSYSGSPNSYVLTVNPASDFTRNTSINWSISADDLEGNSATSGSYSFSVIDNAAPTFTSIPDKSVNEGSLLTFLVQASDSDGDTVSITMDDSNLPSSGAYSSIDSTSGIFTWTAGTNDVGVYNIDFTAADDGPGTPQTVEQVQITVVDVESTGNTPPSITAIADQTYYQGSTATLLINSIDVDGDTITLSASTVATAGISLTSVSNGVGALSINSSLLNLGANLVTVTAVDDAVPTGSSEINFNITVNALPVGSTCSTTSSSGGVSHVQYSNSTSNNTDSSEIKDAYVCSEIEVPICPVAETTTQIEYVTLIEEVEKEVIKEVDNCSDTVTKLSEEKKSVQDTTLVNENSIAVSEEKYVEDKNIFLQEFLIDTSDEGLVRVSGLLVNGDEVRITWYGPYGTVTTIQDVSNNGEFMIYAPIEFTMGRYYVDVVGVDSNSEKVSKGYQMNFEIEENSEIQDHSILKEINYVQANSKMLSSLFIYENLPWLILILALLININSWQLNREIRGNRTN